MTGEETFSNLHEVLRNLYDEMMPLCSDITGVATGVAALGALFYVASRVWQALSRAEPIDIYPLFRPFCLGACIMFFPTFVLGTLNGIMSPVVTGCHDIMEGQTLNIREYSEKRQKLEYEAMTRNPETAYLVDNEEYERQIEDLGWSPSDLKAMAGMAAERFKYQARQGVNNFLRSFLELLFQSVSLVLDTLRTFFLIVLSILGPLSFAISVYDGFHNTMIQWICQYISIYLWLPISDLFSSVLARIQVLMIEKDIAALSDADSHCGVFHHSDSIHMGDSGIGSRQLRQAGQLVVIEGRTCGCRCFRCSRRPCSRQVKRQITQYKILETYGI